MVEEEILEEETNRKEKDEAGRGGGVRRYKGENEQEMC